MKKTITKLLFAIALFALYCSSFAQSVVPVGSGSYASSIPTDKIANWYLPGSGGGENYNVSQFIDGLPVNVLSGVSGPYLTNDWRTRIMVDNTTRFTPDYYTWVLPYVFEIVDHDVVLHYTNSWAGNNIAVPEGITIGGLGFNATDDAIKGWTDWTLELRSLENDNEYIDFTMGKGLPMVWAEYTNIGVATLDFNSVPSFYSTAGGSQGLPYTGNAIGAVWDGRAYGIFAPDGTTFSMSGNTLQVNFSGADSYLVVAVMPSITDLSFFEQYAYAIPRNTEFSYSYNESQAKTSGIYNVTTEALRGSQTEVIHGFLPHHYRNTENNLNYVGLDYTTSRGNMRCAVGNEFVFTYNFDGVLPIFPKAEAIDGNYSETTLNNFINLQENYIPNNGETYAGGKALTMLARYMAMAQQMGNPSAETMKNNLRTQLEDWYTYTPGENTHFFAYEPKFGGMMGFGTGFGSEQYNDQQLHYGYHLYATALLGMYDPSFIDEYGDLAALVAKGIKNWDRSDERFQYFKTFDVWEGHGWARGTVWDNSVGVDQESASEAIVSWKGMFLLANLLGDEQMKAAAAFGYMSETWAQLEYWYDTYEDNFPPSYEHSLSVMTYMGGIAWANWFWPGAMTMYMIEFIPITPSSTYLIRNPEGFQADIDHLLSEQPISQWDNNEYKNINLRAISLFDPDLAMNNYVQGEGGDQQSGLTYGYIHTNRFLGRRDHTYNVAGASGGVFYNSNLNQYTYAAYNYDNVARSFDVLDQSGNSIGSFTVAANSYGYTHELGGGMPVVSITAPSNGASFPSGSNVNIEASASDPDGSITQVQFYADGSLLGSAASAPYTYTWNSPADGSYSITAVATDNDGNSRTSTPVSITVGVLNGDPIPGVVQAEDFDGMFGVQTEPTEDVGGGENVGWIDEGDWMDYDVYVEAAGQYDVDIRIAADGTDTKTFDLMQGADVLGSASFTATGAWQNWDNTQTTVLLQAGGQSIRLYATSTGFNVNWIEFTAVEDPVLTRIEVTPANATLNVGETQQFTATGYDQFNNVMAIVPTWSGADSNGLFTASAAGDFQISATTDAIIGSASVTVNGNDVLIPGVIQAEEWSDMFGVQTEPTDDIGGGLNVGWIDAGDWMEYEVNVTTAGTYNVDFRVAADGTEQKTFELQASNTIAVEFMATNSWQSWITTSSTINLDAGVQTIRLYATSTGFNVNWIEFTAIEVPVLTSIDLSPKNISIDAGAMQQFSAVGYDQFGNVIAFNPSWTGTDANGLFTETIPDTYTVSVSSGNISASTYITVNPVNETCTRYEAEAWANMFGVQTEATADEGGGLNVGWIDINDWIDINIYVTTPGDYTLKLRGATPNGPDVCQVQVDYVVAGQIDIANTGSWQTWETFETTINIPTAGNHVIRLLALTNGFNINWIELCSGGQSEDCIIESANGEFSVEVSTDANNPSLTFNPTTAGTGDNLLLLYYGTDPNGPYPGYMPNVNQPFQISASEGETIYFYYTYSLPSGGENNNSANKNSFTVGQCQTTLKSTEMVTNIVSDLSKVSVYPNPVRDELIVDFNNEQVNEIQLIDLAGNKLLVKETHNEVSLHKLSVNEFEAGIYMLLLINNESVKAFRIVKE